MAAILGRDAILSPLELFSLSHVSRDWRDIALENDLWDKWFEVSDIYFLVNEVHFGTGAGSRSHTGGQYGA